LKDNRESNNLNTSQSTSQSKSKKRSENKKQIYSTDEQTIINVKNEIFKFHRVYKHFLEKKINRLVTIRTIDITICNYVKQYLLNQDKNLESTLESTLDKYIKIPIEKLELITENITEPHNYFVSNIETVMINSDFSINHNINLKRMSKLLKKRGLYNSYEPDEYPGVLTKYYYNINNEVQGLCKCSPHCSTKEKHSICTKITISVFRPGSVIITGARNIDQLSSAYDFIIKILKDNIEYIKGIEYEDDNKHIALMNNEYRKISRKPRLFFIKKSNIINFIE
jgi:TATA-box binding protein (TBP) (component of TFIID and TFIIIB)